MFRPNLQFLKICLNPCIRSITYNPPLKGGKRFEFKEYVIWWARELETDLNDKDNDSEYSLTSQKIQVYEEMHRRLRQLVRDQKEDVNYLHSITELLVFNLIHYGTFMKMNYQKGNNTAKLSLKKALNYDRTNPIAAYRLGFLAYKDKDYTIWP